MMGRDCFRVSNGDFGKAEVRGTRDLHELEVACMRCFLLLLRIPNGDHLLSMLWGKHVSRVSRSGYGMAIAYRSEEGVRWGHQHREDGSCREGREEGISEKQGEEDGGGARTGKRLSM